MNIEVTHVQVNHRQNLPEHENNNLTPNNDIIENPSMLQTVPLNTINNQLNISNNNNDVSHDENIYNQEALLPESMHITQNIRNYEQPAPREPMPVGSPNRNNNSGRDVSNQNSHRNNNNQNNQNLNIPTNNNYNHVNTNQNNNSQRNNDDQQPRQIPGPVNAIQGRKLKGCDAFKRYLMTYNPFTLRLN